MTWLIADTDGDPLGNRSSSAFAFGLQFANALSTSRRALHNLEQGAQLGQEVGEQESVTVFSRLRWLQWLDAQYPRSELGDTPIDDLETSLANTLDRVSQSTDPQSNTRMLEERYLTLKETFLQGACWECTEAGVRRIGGMYSHSRACIDAALRALHDVA